jgi:hypothetical protein
VTLSIRKCRVELADAIHNLTEEPTGENVVRYLVASRNLDDAEKRARRLERARRRGVDVRIRLPLRAAEALL